MKRIRIIGTIFMASVALLGHSYHTIHATDHIEQSDKEITVVFDLGGVLINPNNLKAFWQLGPKTLVPYLIRHRSLTQLKAKFIQTLNLIQKPACGPHVPKDPSGNALPSLIVQWARGDRPNDQILGQTCDAINEHPEWFSNKREQRLIESITQLTFNPHNFARSLKPISKMVKFVQECKEKNYHLCVLSNWDAESFDLLNKKYPELFELFDTVIISGKVHKIKPDPEIFSLITEKVPAETCIFIDDQKENIEAAQRAGMHTIHATLKHPLLNRTPDMKKVREEFAQFEEQCSETQVITA